MLQKLLCLQLFRLCFWGWGVFPWVFSCDIAVGAVVMYVYIYYVYIYIHISMKLLQNNFIFDLEIVQKTSSMSKWQTY